ncbi:hypothetical protein KY289_027253 [Solanum tuberosum]|nr:hypothetical protein KY289_027253 [Solanum tuberosum]
MLSGGLNLINFEIWNKEAICKLLWELYQSKEKSWVVWVHTYYVNGGDIWKSEPKVASWMIQQVFKATRYVENVEITMAEFMGMQQFSIKKMDQLLLGVFPKVSWRKLVCNNRGCPKWTLTLWLAIKGRLQTRDRLVQWSVYYAGMLRNSFITYFLVVQ